MAEINDAELETLKRGFALLQQLNAKPEARRGLEGLIKQHVNKDFVTTDDAAKPYMDAVTAQIKPLVDWKESIEKGQQDWAVSEQLKKLQDRGFQPEGIEKIKAFGKERGISDLVDAADLWESRQPAKPVVPKGFTSSSWDFEKADTDDEKLLLKDEDAWADKMAAKVWGEEVAKQGRE